jgi:Uncharacterized conserved protein
MGQEINLTHFQRTDFHRFERQMTYEMVLLQEWFRTGTFSDSPLRIGLELELWLIDSLGQPKARNTEFLEQVDHEDIVPELSQFNIEFNVPHQLLAGAAIGLMERDLGSLWTDAQIVAQKMGLSLLAIGILPTLVQDDLSLKTMSEMSRFRALNEQVLRLRRGRPITLHIEREETLDLRHHDVMLESAATSLQIHYQVPQKDSVRYFNAAVIASGPVLAVSANSPFLFEKQLWEETRIPLFESAVDLGGPFPRVHFGSGYAHESLEEFFLENRICHPVLLPTQMDEPSELLPHIRLHNGTIWRWNRPLIGFNEDGQPHLRVEFRSLPAGPTLIDMMANVAFATGIIHSLAQKETPPEEALPFEIAESNFHAAAHSGMDSHLGWIDRQCWPIRDLVLEQLLPDAAEALRSLAIDPLDAQRYLSLIEQRVSIGRNGAVWQREFVEKYGRDMALLTREYRDRQRSGEPVHEWSL